MLLFNGVSGEACRRDGRRRDFDVWFQPHLPKAEREVEQRAGYGGLSGRIDAVGRPIPTRVLAIWRLRGVVSLYRCSREGCRWQAVGCSRCDCLGPDPCQNASQKLRLIAMYRAYQIAGLSSLPGAFQPAPIPSSLTRNYTLKRVNKAFVRKPRDERNSEKRVDA